MKTPWVFALICAASSWGLIVQARELTHTNVPGVLNTGSVSYQGPQTTLMPGLYIVGDDDHKWHGQSYLLVDTYVNDPNKVLAVMLPKQVIDSSGGVGSGEIFLGRPIKNGTSVMLSPVTIDITGSLSVESEMETNARVIEVSRRSAPGNYRYPYLLQGHNGALGGQLLGMRASTTQQPRLAQWPSNNVFSGSGGMGHLVVDGTSVGVYSGHLAESHYQLLPLNGDFGKFAELVPTQLDTMSEAMISASQIAGLAIFISGCFDTERMLIASPQAQPGEFQMDMYSPDGRTFSDYLAPGSLQPMVNQGGKK